MSNSKLMNLWYHNLEAFRKVLYKKKALGYKVWCLNTDNGYFIQCDPYSGKGDYNPKLDLGGSMVTKLIQKYT